MRSNNERLVCRLQEFACFVALDNGSLLVCDIDEQGGGRSDDLGNLMWKPVRLGDAKDSFLSAVDERLGTVFGSSYAVAA